MKHLRLIFSLAFLCLLGCRKDDDINLDPSAKLEFSSDSINFDTVFTSVGSVTHRLKVYNRSKQKLKISEIKLLGESASYFKININGVNASRLTDYTLRGNDSINVFIKVSIDPTSANLPFIVEDAIRFSTNGNAQKIPLRAFGQNAVFLKDAVIGSNATWVNTLPYVIYNSVTVGAGKTLNIDKGTTVYFHKDAEMRVAGTLHINGEHTQKVTFQSDRLDEIYRNEPGQWKGIRFMPSSSGSVVNCAVIKNATIGLQVDSASTDARPKLLLANTVISQMELSGLSCNNTYVAAFNNLISECGKYSVFAINGGIYNFKQNTFVNSGFARTAPVAYFSDKLANGTSSPMALNLINNIIWGGLTNELKIDKAGSMAGNIVIRKNFIRSKDASLESSGNILNSDPQFQDARNGNYNLRSTSPALNKGEDLTSDSHFGTVLYKDLNGKVRLFPSEIGCYELQ